MYFDLHLKAPVIVIPLNIFSADDTYRVELHLGEATVSTDLQPFHKEINYGEINQESLVYDIYRIQFEGFSFKLFEDPKKEPKLIIDDINYEIDVYSCLEPLHPLFPSHKICQYFRKPIKFILEERTLTKCYDIYTILMQELSAENMKVVEQKLKLREVAQTNQLDLQEQI